MPMTFSDNLAYRNDRLPRSSGLFLYGYTLLPNFLYTYQVVLVLPFQFKLVVCFACHRCYFHFSAFLLSIIFFVSGW